MEERGPTQVHCSFLADVVRRSRQDTVIWMRLKGEMDPLVRLLVNVVIGFQNMTCRPLEPVVLQS